MVEEISLKMLLEIRESVKDCSDRGLTMASKWSTDLLLGMSPAIRATLNAEQASLGVKTSRDLRPTETSSQKPSASPPIPGPSNPSTQPAGPQTAGHHPLAPKPVVWTAEELKQEYQWQAIDHDLLLGAKACFDVREYMRCHQMLSKCQSSKANFLGTYALFLATERQALLDWHKLDGTRNQPPEPINEGVNSCLTRVVNAKDPWCQFLKALFLSRLSRREEAIETVLHSIASYPWNWSAWTLLCNCIQDADELQSLLPLVPLPSTHPLVQFFIIKTSNELQSPSETELVICDRLLADNRFPHCLWLMSLRASVLYHLHDYEAAENQFDHIRDIDPCRIDDIDIFSNILYVQDNKLKLSRMAAEYLALDKDRPEVCCLVGNHYSIRQEHEKAVKYFRRATQLDRTYLTAWTLMGHEYVEMKNSQAAIEAYRRAVEVNRKDYRAWYGLGQAYELLSMHHYALYYYQHATALRPYDVRLWQAQGSCYEEVGRPREAIECYKRALISSEAHEATLCLKLARLHRLLEEHGEAVAYHKRVVDLAQSNNRPVTEYAKSSLEVAEYHMNVTQGDLLLAKGLLEQISTSNAEDVAKATELLKVVKARMQQKGLGLAGDEAGPINAADVSMNE